MKTLLQDFIDKKMAGYNPPASKRAGGFSEQKYRATLLFLTNKLQEDIAKEVGVSFGLLRKWRTEKLFLDTIEKHGADFSHTFIENLPGEELKFEFFCDIKKYNKALTPLIISALFKIGLSDHLVGFVLLSKINEIVHKYLPKNEYPYEHKTIDKLLKIFTLLQIKKGVSELKCGEKEKDKILTGVNYLLDIAKLEF